MISEKYPATSSKFKEQQKNKVMHTKNATSIIALLWISYDKSNKFITILLNKNVEWSLNHVSYFLCKTSLIYETSAVW